MSWYVSIGGQTYGPADAGNLREWFLAGTFAPSDFAWDEGTQAWVEAGRVPALSGVFVELPTSSLGVADIEELPRGNALLPETARTMEEFCGNHADDPATAICPRCQRSLCDRCMAAEADGLRICVDCDAEQKNAATRSYKKHILTWSAPVLLVLGMLSIYTVFAPAPAEQPVEPPVVVLEKGEAPRLSDEELTPAEKEKASADLRALAAAFTAWKTETPAGASRLAASASDSWIALLVEAGSLPAPVQPPRPELVYRLSEDGKQVELWTRGTTGRAFFVLKGDTLAFVPRSTGASDTPAANRR